MMERRGTNKSLAHLALLFVLLLATSACRGKPVPAIKLAEAPLAMDSVTMLVVAEPPTNDEGEPITDEEQLQWFADYIRSFNDNALRAGFRVVKEGKHDVRVVLKTERLAVGGNLSPPSHFSALFTSPDGKSVIASAEHVQREKIKRDGSAQWVAITLLNQAIESRRMASYFGYEPTDVRVADGGGAESQRAAARKPAAAPREKHEKTDFVMGAPQRNAYALVIGIESYRDVGTKASGALADAKLFKKLAMTTMAIPEKHIRMALGSRATKVDIEKHVDWLVEHAPKQGRIYFFFSGHGAPDASAGTAYLLPYDGDPQALDRTALPLKEVLARLKQSQAAETVAFVDTCFSGSGGRSVLPKGSRPLVRMKAPPTTSRVALFSAASGAQISGPNARGNHGLFTHYLTSGVGNGDADMDGDGQVTLKELHDWIAPRVEREAKEQGRDQSPSLIVPPDVTVGDVVIAHGVK